MDRVREEERVGQGETVLDTGTAPLRLAFFDLANLGWTAGLQYYRNLFSALRRLDDDRRPHIAVVVPPSTRSGRSETYLALADEVIETPVGPGSGGGFGRRQVRRVQRRLGGGGGAWRLERTLRARRIDAMFASVSEFGPSFGVPLLGWIHDFQHKHYPEFFAAKENQARDRLYERMAAHCSRIVLSSHDARQDYERFFPAHAGKARVLQFVAEVPEGVYEGDPRRMCDEYDLPERFLYLPNQFWVHKNHGLVVDALAVLKTRRPDITVVCTGNPADHRDPLYFGELLAKISRLGLRERFVVLGWVPHAHTARLLRQSVAALQPSLFEGWSTTVEEAKSIGKTIVLSDILIHREQAPPSALYVDPADPEALADLMVEAYDTRSPGPDEALEAEARAAMPGRTRAYAETFLAIAADAKAWPSA